MRNHIIKILFTSICVFTSIFLNSWVKGQGTSNECQQMFGVLLDENGQRLRVEIEKLYGKRIEEQWLKTKVFNGTLGRSEVTKEGIPRISIDSINGRDREVVEHELFHLIYIYRGFPHLIIERLNARDFQSSVVLEDFYLPILHSLFYDTLRLWDINPCEKEEKSLKSRIGNNRVTEITNLPLRYFRWRVEGCDSLLVKIIAGIQIENGRSAEIKTGEELFEIVRSKQSQKPEEVIVTLIECLNVFYQHEFSFTVMDWSSQVTGYINQRWVRLRVDTKK